jgi:putative PIG3 family NAD(P)H quinone oxidoreductase
MRAIKVRKPGGVEELEIVEVPDPEPGPGQLLVRVFATALNRADILQRRGLYPPPPGESHIPGLEFAGEVARAGPGTGSGAAGAGYRRGDRVFGLCGSGGYAELIAIDERLALPIPDVLSYDAAAALPEAFFTAQEALFTLGELGRGQTLLVHAGASGVGTAAIQLGRLHGARVLATAGSREKTAKCRELGADMAIDYLESDFAAVIEGALGCEAVDVVLDLVGAKHWERNLRVLRSGGRLLVVGLLGGARVEVDLGVVLRRRLRIIGTAMRTRSLEDKVAITRRFRDQHLPRFAAGELVPVIDSVFPFEEVQAAHARMEANLNAGKIVLRL